MESWYEIAIKASSREMDEILAPLAGETLFRDRELEIEPESLGERVRGLFGADTHHWVFASEPTARRIAAAVRSQEGVELEGVRRVNGARFTVTLTAFSPEVRDALRESLFAPRPGISESELVEIGERRAEAYGVELYSPAHEYVWKAEGTLAGTPPAIFELYQEAQRRDFVEPSPLVLDAEDVAPDSL